MNEHRKLTLRRESLSELTRHELQGVAAGDAQGSWTTCPQVVTVIATCVDTYTIATCTCPTGPSCACPTDYACA